MRNDIRYCLVEFAIDRTEIFRSMMAHYALLSAGKSDESQIPMQYARCDIEKIFNDEIFYKEMVALCGQLSAWVRGCRWTSDTTVGLTVRVPRHLPRATVGAMRRGVESCLVAMCLRRCLVPVPAAEREIAALADRSRLSLSAVRQMLSL